MNQGDEISNTALRKELQAVEDAIAKEQATGAVDDHSKHVRVRYGVYSLRNQPGRYVVRVRLPGGIIQPGQLDFLADAAEKYSGCGAAHLTTRQGIQIADVRGSEVGAMVREIESHGMTTRMTGGNGVRGVVCCAWSGISVNEVFDATPYAVACDRALRDHPDFQSLPRKIKIAFESCADDHVRTSVCDIGLRAALRDGEQGFQLSVGGGLGAIPIAGSLLEDFTPIAALMPTLESILRVFNLYGDRNNRMQARLKWLIRARGIDWFRDAVQMEKARAGSDKMQRPLAPAEGSPGPRGRLDGRQDPSAAAFREWKAFSARPQRQPGLCAVMVRCLLGDLRPPQMRCLAEAARRFGGGALRTTIDQNVALRSIEESALPDLFEFLSKEGLASCCAEQVMDVTRCVGGEACVSAITNPVGAAQAVMAIFTSGLKQDPAVRDLRIRVSGCPNACSHHPLADIGLSGAAKRAHGKMVPHYAVRVGGRQDGDFGYRLIEVPACNLSASVERILRFYLREKLEGETLRRFVERKGLSTLRAQLEDLTQVPAPQEAPGFYKDLDAAEDFVLAAKEGECFA